MNTRWRWYEVPPVAAFDPMHSWLVERGSLTNRLRSICRHFRVLVQCSRIAPVFPDEIFLLAAQNNMGTKTMVREVSLICDERPLVFGHTILMTRKSGPLAMSFRRIGNRSLGSLLFASPDCCRGPIYFKRIDRQHPLYPKSLATLGEAPFFLARRSVFSSQSEQVCVTEVFSPQLAGPPVLQLS